MRATRLLIATALAVLALSLGGVAWAQSGGNIDRPSDADVLGITEEQPAPPDSPPGTLPFTGADVTLFAVIGLAAIGTGIVILRTTRSRRQTG